MFFLIEIGTFEVTSQYFAYFISITSLVFENDKWTFWGCFGHFNMSHLLKDASFVLSLGQLILCLTRVRICEDFVNANFMLKLEHLFLDSLVKKTEDRHDFYLNNVKCSTDLTNAL